MSNYDVVYARLVSKILKNGIWDKDQQVRTVWDDGTPAYTKSTISEQLIFDNSEVPILTTKRVAWKSAIYELLWFYVKRTSNVSYLRENNVKIWEAWTREDGTIGKAYGYQLGKAIFLGDTVPITDCPLSIFGFTNQIHNLIHGLKTNPASRRHVISLWNIDDLHDMALYPCVWHNQWLVKEGKLHLIVGVRSNDVALGQPFNVFQYYVLQRMIAQVTGYEMGTLTFNINDVHIYERHIEPLSQQILLEPYDAPILNINPDVKNFDDFKIEDFELVNYQHHPSIKMEVAI
ncbi:thymidylate synthase [Brevibacillus laterosporus]|uniref:thymidylate synthase n=1 Tax=Brevibacillus phage Sundance TaxID=1691958 RepID=UPI0006BDE4EC|nr:thymidylate synthase [Brevibacillus phage Sundance]ALA47913.1 putative thymidylate synthase [Brevibacillus phage Sundance]